jgi:hypothetical protein
MKNKYHPCGSCDVNHNRVEDFYNIPGLDKYDYDEEADKLLQKLIDLSLCSDDLEDDSIEIANDLYEYTCDMTIVQSTEFFLKMQNKIYLKVQNILKENKEIDQTTDNILKILIY